jgi:predicted RNA-binding Zn-ribbon protein involved in translation (DUF1610 family)
MKKLYSFKWFQFNLKNECSKCGNNIVFQDFEGKPTCNECGYEEKFDWPEVLKEIGITGVTAEKWGNSKIMGGFNASANAEPVEYIDCYHCNSHLLLPDNTDTKNFNCTSCNEPLSFYEYPEFKDLIFYKSGDNNNNNKDTGIKPIAVRCVSCGAPLEVDPTKNSFNCKFCSTDNILPTSMRYKVVLSDIFVADKKARYPKLLAFEKDGKIMEQVLRIDGKESIQDDTLDKLLLSEKNDISTYNLILKEYKYRPSDKILNELFSTSSNQTIIERSGTRLQKSQEEIDDRIQQINPGYKKAKKEAVKAATKAADEKDIKKTVEKEMRKSALTTKLIMIVTFIVVGVILLYSFGIL